MKWTISRVSEVTWVLTDLDGQELAKIIILRGTAEQQTAIIRLMDAAPELLEACEASRKESRHNTICPLCRKGNLCEEGMLLWARAGDMRDAAIAKAEGTD